MVVIEQMRLTRLDFRRSLQSGLCSSPRSADSFFLSGWQSSLWDLLAVVLLASKPFNSGLLFLDEGNNKMNYQERKRKANYMHKSCFFPKSMKKSGANQGWDHAKRKHKLKIL